MGIDKMLILRYLQRTSGVTMSTILLRSIEGGRKRVHAIGLAGLVRGEFACTPHLADFLEQCFIALEKKRWPMFDSRIGATLWTEPVMTVVLREMCGTLEARFGKVDADPERARVLLDRFMPFRNHELVTTLAAQEFAPLRERVTEVKSDFQKFLVTQQGNVNQGYTIRLLVFINTLALLAVIPSPRAVVDAEHQLARLVERFLDVEDVNDDDTYVPSAEDRAKTTYASTRIPPVPLHRPPPRLTLVKE